MCAIGRKKGKTYSSQNKTGPGHRGRSQGRLSIIGTGPGNIKFLSQRALETLHESEVIVGYRTYVKLLGDLLSGKEVISSGMTQEIRRAKQAIKRAQQGEKVALISSGDPGIYGMAGLVLELFRNKKSKVKIEIIPGITALSSSAALLGAPLMHDFAVISLSDLLTDMRLIKRRIKLAAQADFVIVFYNPQSKSRVVPLKDAWRILMKYRSGQTPVGIVRNAYRENESVEIAELKNMFCSKIIDMFTTIIVGNSKTYIKGKLMITPRGY